MKQKGESNGWSLLDDNETRMVTRRWIGPIGCPFGDFAENIAEFSIEMHEEAQSDINKPGEVLVMRHVDTKHIDRVGGSITTVGRLPKGTDIAKWLAVNEPA